MASAHRSQLSAAARELLDPAWQMRWRVPELALMLSDRAIAHARGTGESALRLRAEAIALFALNRLGRGVASAHRAVTAVRDAEAANDEEVLASLQVELACAARHAGSCEIADRVLDPVLRREQLDPTVRAHALIEHAAVAPAERSGHSGHARVEALDEAERLYTAAEPHRDTNRVLRARVSNARACLHRRRGQFSAAADAAGAGLSALAALDDQVAESGEIHTCLILEQVHALLELGRRSDAVQAADPVLRQPVRAAAAGPSGWLRFALATRVYLAEGERATGVGLLNEAVATAERHAVDTLLVEALSALSHVYERGAEFTEALRCVRGAHAADRRWRSSVHAARVRLVEEFPAPAPNAVAPRRRAEVPERAAQSTPAQSTPAEAPAAPEPTIARRSGSERAAPGSEAERAGADPTRPGSHRAAGHHGAAGAPTETAVREESTTREQPVVRERPAAHEGPAYERPVHERPAAGGQTASAAPAEPRAAEPAAPRETPAAEQPASAEQPAAGDRSTAAETPASSAETPEHSPHGFGDGNVRDAARRLMETLTGRSSGVDREEPPADAAAAAARATANGTVPKPRDPDLDEPWSRSAGGSAPGAPTFPTAYEQRSFPAEQPFPDESGSAEQRPVQNEAFAAASPMDPGFPEYDTAAADTSGFETPTFGLDESRGRRDLSGNDREDAAFPVGSSAADPDTTTSLPALEDLPRWGAEPVGRAYEGTSERVEEPAEALTEPPEESVSGEAVAGAGATSPHWGKSLAEIRASLRKIQERSGVPPAVEDGRAQAEPAREEPAREEPAREAPAREAPPWEEPPWEEPGWEGPARDRADPDRDRERFPDQARLRPDRPERGLPEWKHPGQDDPGQDDPGQGRRRRARHAEPEEPAQPAEDVESDTFPRSAHSRGEPASEFLARYKRAVRDGRSQREGPSEHGGPRADEQRREDLPAWRSGPASDSGPVSDSPVADPGPPPESGPQSGPTPESGDNAGLADLLAEALVAYETGKKDDSPAAPDRPESASRPGASNDDASRRDTRRAAAGRPAAEYLGQSTSDGSSVPTRHRRAAVDAASTSSPAWTPGR